MKALIATALLLPGLAFADIGCKVERAAQLPLDLNGVSTLVVEMGSDTVRIDGAANADGVVKGRACASTDKRLGLLTLSQERHGDRLVLKVERARGETVLVFFGSDYAHHDLNVKVPPSLAIELHMGSGDAVIHQIASLDAHLGSGDLEANQIAGALQLAVGSGDVVAANVGTLHIDSVGSGDVTVDGVSGDTHIGSVGSGDVTVREAKGAVSANSLGSGDITLKAIGGKVELNRMGSGDLYVTDIDGDVVVNHIGSGDVHSRNVKGEVIKPRS